MRKSITAVSLPVLILSIGTAIAQAPAPGGSLDENQRPGRTQSPNQGSQQTPPQRGQEAPPARAQAPVDRGTNQARPQQEQERRPGQAEPQRPDQPRQAQPQQGQERRPGQAESQRPDQPRQAQPQQGQERRPGQAETQRPDQPRQAQPQQGQERRPGQAETQRPDQPRQAQPQQPGQQQRGAEGRTGADTTVTGSIAADPERATRLRASIEQARVPEAQVNVDVRVGVNLPRSVTLVAPPPALIEIAPRYRDYRVVRVREQLVIVDPATYRVVEVVQLSSGRAGQATGRSLSLSTQQQQIVRRYAHQQGRSRIAIEVQEGRPLAREVELHALPDEVIVEVPELREYRYVVSGDRIIIVEPSTRVVAEVIR